MNRPLPDHPAYRDHMTADYARGVRDTIHYLVEFMDGAAAVAQVLSLPAMIDAFISAANEMCAVTPAQVWTDARYRQEKKQ